MQASALSPGCDDGLFLHCLCDSLKELYQIPVWGLMTQLKIERIYSDVLNAILIFETDDNHDQLMPGHFQSKLLLSTSLASHREQVANMHNYLVDVFGGAGKELTQDQFYPYKAPVITPARAGDLLFSRLMDFIKRKENSILTRYYSLIHYDSRDVSVVGKRAEAAESLFFLHYDLRRFGEKIVQAIDMLSSPVVNITWMDRFAHSKDPWDECFDLYSEFKDSVASKLNQIDSTIKGFIDVEAYPYFFEMGENADYNVQQNFMDVSWDFNLKPIQVEIKRENIGKNDQETFAYVKRYITSLTAVVNSNKLMVKQ